MRRVAGGWTAEALGDRVGVDKSTIRRWEKEGNAPTAENVSLLAAALNCKPKDFSRLPRLV